MTEARIYILLPIHNRKESTRTFIKCLQKQIDVNYELVVIDDGSHDGSFEMIKDLIPGAIQIRGNGNWWWGGSLQQGYLWLRRNANPDDFLLIINDDCVIDEKFLSTGIEILLNNPKSLLLAEAYSMQTDKLVDKGVVFDFKNFSLHTPSAEEKINCLSTRGLFLRVSDLLELRGFRNRLLPHYYSDYEFTMRAGRNGFNLMVSDKLKLWMNEATTGIDSLKDVNTNKFIGKLFSKKYKGQPVYTLNFILLTFPFPYNIKFATRHIFQTIIILLKIILGKGALN